jgi:acyl-coenzyme A synthetase/AMP-(fatty) acid ligase
MAKLKTGLPLVPCRHKASFGTCVADLPLIRNFGPNAVFAQRHGSALCISRFLAHVRQVAADLPAASHAVNLCTDRYNFSVAFSAALMRRQVSLLPPNQTPELFSRLSQSYPGAYCIVDSDIEHQPLTAIRLPDWVDRHERASAIPSFPETQIAAIVLTSGSTGESTPHPKTWGALVASVSAEFERLGLKAESGTAIVGTVPPQHMYGLESTVVLAMQGGLTMHAARPFYPSDIAAELQALPRPRALVTTPIHLRTLIAESAVLPPVDFLICATAPLSPQLAAAAETRFAAPLYEVYGCTEAGQVATRRTVKTSEWSALPGITLRQDEHGTWIKGGHVYQEVLLGDVIELRSRKRFLLHGRHADLVNIAGKRTSLAHLNYHLNSIEGVTDGVFVVPEAANGETVTRLMALVVAPGMTKQELMKALRRRVDAAFLPRPLCLVDALPRNATSKLPREALANLVSELATRAA